MIALDALSEELVMEKNSVIAATFKAIQTALEAVESLNTTQREFALAMIVKGLGISGSTSIEAGNGSAHTHTKTAQTDLTSVSPKDFLRDKKPQTDLERLTCLAYYLTHARGTAHFKTEDITALNTEAAGPRFANASATARNAVSQSRFLSHAGTGKKQLTALGEDVVTALPNRDAVAQVVAEAPKRSKRRGRAKAKGKTSAGA
jgi:hypothetical protein